MFPLRTACCSFSASWCSQSTSDLLTQNECPIFGGLQREFRYAMKPCWCRRQEETFKLVVRQNTAGGPSSNCCWCCCWCVALFVCFVVVSFVVACSLSSSSSSWFLFLALLVVAPSPLHVKKCANVHGKDQNENVGTMRPFQFGHVSNGIESCPSAKN